MSTSAEYVNVVAKKLFGYTDFGDRFLTHVRDLVHGSMEKVWNAGAVYDSALAMAGDGNDKFEMVGTSLATDGKGHILDIANATENDELQFENATGVDYYVAMKYCEIPSGVSINPRTGWPQYLGWVEEIGESDEPDAVTDNGNGTITFQVDSVTEPGVTNAGRRVLVYKVDPAHEAITSAIAIETCTVAWTSSQNRITTTAALGQTTISTTASDYRVVLLGPTVKRNTDLRYTLPYTYIGYITGNGPSAVPTSFNYDDQDVASISFSKLSHITRVASNGRLKIDVKPIAGETNENQIQSRNTSGGIVFSVDENGNVEIAGDLTVQGETTQNDVVIVNSSETITDNLTAGDDDATDSHLIKGTWRHTNNAETANYFVVDGATGKIGINQAAPTGSYQMEITGGLKSNSDGGIVSETWFLAYGSEYPQPSYQYRMTYKDVDDHGLWRTDVDWNGHWRVIENTAAAGNFSTTRIWIEVDADAADQAVLFDSHVHPRAPGTWDLGSATLSWSSLHVEHINLWDSAGYGANTNVVPTAANTYNLGNATYYWKDIHCDKIYANYVETPGSSFIFDGDIIPSVHSLYDLGSISYYWDDLYVDKIHLGEGSGLGFLSDCNPAAGMFFDLGSSGQEWNVGYFNTVNTNFLYVDTTGGYGATNSINPSATGTYDLGSGSYKWNDVYGVNGLFDTLSVLSSGGNGVIGDFEPSADNSYDLGSGSYRWRIMYGMYLYVANTSGYGLITDLVPNTDDTYTLGYPSYRYYNVHTSRLDVDDAAGKGVDNHLVPVATSTYNLGGSSYRWQYLYAGTVDAVSIDGDYFTPSAGAGQGFATDVVPTTNNTRSLGNSSYYWNALYSTNITATTYNGGGAILDTLFLDGGATDGVTSSLFKPQSDNTSSLGSATYRWASCRAVTVVATDVYASNGYFDYIEVDSLLVSNAGGQGVAGDLHPDTTNSYTLGEAAYRWSYLYGSKLSVSNTAGDGCYGSFYPTSDQVYDCGSATYAWDDIYCDDLYYDTGFQSYDDQDDLGLIEKYGPVEGKFKTINKGGLNRKVQVGDGMSIPWPMLGPIRPGTGRSFLSIGGSVMFLLGAMKQLYQRHEYEKEGLKRRIEKLEEQLSFS